MTSLREAFFRLVLFALLVGVFVEGDERARRNCRHTIDDAKFGSVHKEDQRRSSAHFGYKNVKEWKKDFPNCGGARQSPIYLNTKDMTKLDVPSALNWVGYDRPPIKMTLENNGHSVQLSGIWEPGRNPTLSGGFLEGDYEFVQMHFHWGPENDVGSEHMINNRSMPLEMHLVHYKKAYGSFAEALKYGDGLAVVGCLFVIGIVGNRGITEMLPYGKDVKTEGSKVEIKPFPLSEFNTELMGDYVAYLGSLTTPPCSEVAVWIIPAVPYKTTRRQLELFRNVQLANGDDHNYRPPMPRQGRIIYYISDKFSGQNNGVSIWRDSHKL